MGPTNKPMYNRIQQGAERALRRMSAMGRIATVIGHLQNGHDQQRARISDP